MVLFGSGFHNYNGIVKAHKKEAVANAHKRL